MALAIARALLRTPSQSRRDNPDLAALVPESEGTATLEEFITAVLMVFSLWKKHFDVTNIGLHAATFQLRFMLPAITEMNMTARVLCRKSEREQ